MELEHLADVSNGFVGADLQALVKEAAMFSLREYLIKHEENSEFENNIAELNILHMSCLLYTSPSPRDRQKSRMPSSA